jgi:fucose permease
MISAKMIDQMGVDKPKYSLAAFYPLTLAAGMILIFPGPVMDSVIRKFGVTKSVAGQIPFLFFIGQFFGLFFLSELARIIGTKRLFIISLALSAITLALLAAAPQFFMLLPLFFVVGFADAALWSFPGVIATGISRDNVGRGMNYLYGFFAVGVTLEPMTAGWLVGKNYGFGAVALMLSGLSVLVLVWVLFAPLPELKNIQRLSFSGFAGLIRGSGRLFLLLFLGLFCYIASEQGLSVWIPKFFTDRFPANSQFASLTLSGIWFLLGVGRFFFGWVSKWLDRTALLFALSLVSLIASASAALAPGPASCMALYLVYGLAMSGIFPLLLAYCEGFPEQYVSMAFGLILAGGYLGGATGSFPVGFLAERFSFSAAMLYPASLILFLVIIVPFLKKSFVSGKKA